ncbi:MAG: PKD domain-containing protein [Bacteroidales bacterium]|jgi:PKD repeat protein|nr:PKD domain-containing protein [Bacteroidales bacterium]
MKKLLLPVLLLWLINPAMPQGWIFIEGTVADSLDGSPVINHPVTITSDSSHGVLYYNVVLTDSAGHYFDDVPVLNDTTTIVYISTPDCNGVIHQQIISYLPGVEYYTVDFRICDTIVLPCQAFFTYYETWGLTYLFTDQSTGETLIRLWDFGDGMTSDEHDPVHTFPGPGTYDVCLTITSNYCTDTYCETITISDTVFQQLYGQVFAGNFPLQSGTVFIYALNPAGGYLPLFEGFPVDSNGIYYFTLVPEGTYLIQAIPGISEGFLPTYYGDALNWQQATQFTVGIPEDPFNINLVPSGPMTPGPGSVSGQITNSRTDRTQVDNMNVILMDENLSAIGFSGVSQTGYFEFPSMDYGIYHLRAELSGVYSDNMKFEITAKRPHLDLTLNYTGNSVLGLGDPGRMAGYIAVSPNPVSALLTVTLNLPDPDEITIDICSMTGKHIYHEEVNGFSGQYQIIIPTGNFPAGIYSLKVSSADGLNLAKKFIRQ